MYLKTKDIPFSMVEFLNLQLTSCNFDLILEVFYSVLWCSIKVLVTK